MSGRWIGVAAVVVVAAGIVLLKQRSNTAAAHDRGPPTASAPEVLLFADARQAEASCGCGQIIRLVRAAATHGARVRELDPAGADGEARRHRVRVQPTVLVLDRDGRETGRFEGEARPTIDAIRSALRRLAPRLP